MSKYDLLIYLASAALLIYIAQNLYSCGLTIATKIIERRINRLLKQNQKRTTKRWNRMLGLGFQLSSPTSDLIDDRYFYMPGKLGKIDMSVVKTANDKAFEQLLKSHI